MPFIKVTEEGKDDVFIHLTTLQLEAIIEKSKTSYDEITLKEMKAQVCKSITITKHKKKK